MAHTVPTLLYESRLWDAGYRAVAGIDEAGRGALAGPVVAAAVIVPCRSSLRGIWAVVRDSKTLSAPVREELAAEIERAAAAWGVGVVSQEEIDAHGIAPATRSAMIAAVEALAVAADALLIDWVRLPTLNIHQQSLTKADANIVSVAAASILAKVTRDRLMAACAPLYPAYAFASNKGYGTAAHLVAIERCGPCPLHRRSFAPFAGANLFGESAVIEPGP